MRLYCSYCGNECDVTTIEVGEGATEYFGALSFDKADAYVSTCHQQDIVTEDDTPVPVHILRRRTSHD